MKFVIAGLLFFSQVCMADGTRGGGNHEKTPPPTEAQVLAAIKRAKAEFPQSEEIEFISVDTMFIPDFQLRGALRGIFALKSSPGPHPLEEEFRESPIQVQTPPCKDQFGQDAGSSTEFRSGAPICLSVSRLMLIPTMELEIEISALLLHELAHHMGVSDERMARRIQRYFKHEFLANADEEEVGYKNSVQGRNWMVSKNISYQNDISQFIEGKFDNKICEKRTQPSSNPYLLSWLRDNFPEFTEIRAAHESLLDKRFRPMIQAMAQKEKSYCNGELSKESLSKYIESVYEPSYRSFYFEMLKIYLLDY